MDEAVLSAIQNEVDSLSKAERAMNADDRESLIVQRAYRNAAIYADMFGVDCATLKAGIQQHTGLVETKTEEQ